MAKNSSFDIVSQIDMQELDNALNQTRKEIEQRYDFRGSNATIELADGDLKLAAEDEYKLGAILDILRQQMAKRGLSLGPLNPGRKVNPRQRDHPADRQTETGYRQGKQQKKSSPPSRLPRSEVTAAAGQPDPGLRPEKTTCRP